MCTGIKMDYPESCVLGRTMDIEAPVDYNVIYQPRNYPCADNLLGGKHLSRYQIMGVGFRNQDPLKDGINEHGLIGVTNDFGGFNLFASQADPDKTNLSSYHFMNYVLANFRSVEELLEALPQLHLSSHDSQGNKVIAPDFHFMFADSSQRCVVIEPYQQTLKVYANPYNVMTNSPKFPSHEKYLLDLFDLQNLDDFNGAKALPGGYDPKSRFVKAFYQSQNSLVPEDSQTALGYLFRVLSAVALPQGFIKNQKFHSITFTQYISAYDGQDKSLYIQAVDNPIVYRLAFEDIDDLTKRQSFYLEENFMSQNLN
ncbi:linear amide C-N hydrolase [Facklamia sp. DSM 111018]|uniref:Linear amide C-N hydrolase n=1 Tax=Facklamia lactis TaxID=2749967 RepID=A0ABS0LPV0_9LACT|nr:linear amide C-N hydrolase [Facklamia lactis]MBG9986167.1 linear amide C-N hydrolase [Facklamia lactis]